MKKVIVTGVTGQDGSYMVDYLLKNTEHEVWGIVRRTSKPDLGNLKDAIGHPRFKTIVGDLSDSASIDNVVKQVMPDYFINLAAQSFVGSSWQIPEQTFDVDAMGVIRCLEAIRKHVPNCRFYNAGSSEEHGDVQYSPQDMAHPQRARSPYGAAKIAARQIVKVYRESYNLYAVQGLLFNHESPRRGEEFVSRKITLGVARIAKAIKEGKPFEPIELGNLDAKRDWSHAEDFVDGIWRMINQDVYRDISPKVFAEWVGAYGVGESEWYAAMAKHVREYILSSGETHSVREFLEKACAAAGIMNGAWHNNHLNDLTKETYRIYSQTAADSAEGQGDDDIYVEGTQCLVRINPIFYRPADVELLIGDSTPAHQELGWAPKHSFDDLVKAMVENDLRDVGL